MGSAIMGGKLGRRGVIPSVARPSLVVLMLLGLEICGQDVLIVDQSTGPYYDIQPAIDAATDGDTVLVRSGSASFVPFVPDVVISGKSIHLIADGNAILHGFCTSAIHIANTSTNQRVVVRGFTIESDDVQSNPTVLVTACQGPVLFEECTAQLNVFWCMPPTPGSGGALVHIINSPRVSFRACSLGNLGFGVPNYDAVAVDSSSTSFYSCILQGGSTQSTDFLAIFPEDGGAGLRLGGGSFAYLSTCQVAGGTGGMSYCCFSFPARDGGPGVQITGGSELHLMATAVSGGGAGAGCPNGTPIGGVPGPVFDLQSGSIDVHSGSSRQSWTSGPRREGQILELIATGSPGDTVLWAISASQDHLWLPWANAVLVVEWPATVLPAFNVGSTGSLTLAITVPELGPGVDVLTALLQAGFIESGTSMIFLGGPSQAVLLDGAL